jgi:hypothetical protein
VRWRRRCVCVDEEDERERGDESEDGSLDTKRDAKVWWLERGILASLFQGVYGLFRYLPLIVFL